MEYKNEACERISFTGRNVIGVHQGAVSQLMVVHVDDRYHGSSFGDSLVVFAAHSLLPHHC